VFDTVKAPKPGQEVKQEPEKRPGRQAFDVSLLSQSELLALRARIDERLPTMTLQSMNLESELVLQYHTVKALQTDTLEDKYIEPNKKASVVNACASALSLIVKMQTDLYNAERFKAIETIMIRALKTLPKEAVDTFLNEYEQLGKS
jgi:hypothetical protein